MLSSSSVLDAPARDGVASAPAQGLRPWHSDLLARLSQWFSIDFELIDGQSGELVYCPFDQSAREADHRGALCRAVSAAGRAAILEDDAEPLVVMAIPVAGDNPQQIVAVGIFVTTHDASAQQAARVARILGVTPEEAHRWIARQTTWNPSVLLRMGQLAAERLNAEWRLRALEREARDLSLHLSATYEEISLIYRLTQNLKLSSKDEELGRQALNWLTDILPAESLVLYLPAVAETAVRDARTEEVWMTEGPCPIERADLERIIAQRGIRPGQRPVVLNEIVTLAADWPCPGVRQLILVSLVEGDHCFGWMAAINHTSGGEFGTVEATLLSSIAAILGIHSGNAELYQQQRELFAGVVRALTSAIDAKDPYTCGHSDRVARVSVRLAEELGCSRHQVDTIYLSGLLHDVGKIGIDDNVLRKPGKLTEAEYEHIKTHAAIGHKILSDIKQLDEVLPVVLHHHEQWNGKGYPEGLAGETIPFLARIVAVADSFDAMGSDRPYRPGMPDEKLDAILREGAGSQWDADVVAAFFRARNDIREIAKTQVRSISTDSQQLS